MPDKQSIREWMKIQIFAFAKRISKGELIASGDLADSILSHLREEIEKVKSRLTDGEIFSTPSSKSSPTNIHSLLDYWKLREYKMEVAKAQEFKTKQAILKLLDDKNKEN